ncbi:hypothetical protein ANN_21250 [Periplaneta americana]|uniref:Uncharacterized protein n=1 Tax=Periplaneta americana TaxID=6978 RepID=A0ABQ8SET6_PERAM|nr:hypothetical protein ANN_21250 [Periplaneta americana]
MGETLLLLHRPYHHHHHHHHHHHQLYGSPFTDLVRILNQQKTPVGLFKRFHEGKETIEDEPRSGRSSTSRTPEMIEKVRQMLAQDRRLSLGLIAEEFDISKDTMHTIVRDDLGKRKICSRFVPHKLTDEQKAKRMETSGDFISMCDQDSLLLKTIVTGDETWCYQFDPESKRQSMSWCSPTSLQPKKKPSAKIQGGNIVDRLLRLQRHHPQLWPNPPDTL